MFQYSSESLPEIIQSNSYDLDYKYRVITELKAHIKRDFVDLSEVPGYFDALKLANKSSDFKLSSLAFSSICHLVKRVGMQDPTSLRNSSKIVLPILINRLLDSKSTLKTQAKSSLETFWLATPSIVESYVRDTALIHSNQRIRSESIVFISDLIELNKNFDFLSFLPNLVNLLRDDSIEVVKNVEVLLLKYFTFNKSKLSELIKEFKSQKMETRKAVKILRDLDLAAANSYAAEAKTQSKSSIDTFSNLTRPKKQIPSLASSHTRSVSTSSMTSSQELSDILSKIPTAKIDESVNSVSIRSGDELTKEIEKLLAPFQGKETEFNWSAREKSIIRFRGLVIGNADDYPEELVQGTRTLLDGITKSTLSLRTTLSSNGCQLIKELAVYLTKQIDQLAENLFQSLASLTSATKKITSLNSFGSICVLLTNTSFNNRLFNQCFNLYQDKNIQPRLYSSTFLQIYLLKHGSKLDQINLETINKWLGKGVADPNTTVRESMRVTYWIFNRKFNELSEILFSKLDSNVQKNLERSRPRDGSAGTSTNKSSSLSRSSTNPEKKRQSIREFVAAQQPNRRSTSGPQSTSVREPPTNNENVQSHSASDIGRPNRIGVPQRVRAASGEFQQLQRQVSKGSSSAPLRHSYQQPMTDTLSKEESTELHPEIESLKKLLKSPLTRERNEGVQELERIILSNEIQLPDLTTSFFNLVILDTHLLKPLLRYPNFFKVLDVSLALKILAVNKSDLSIISQVIDSRQILNGFSSLITTLESSKFDNAPSTMFHIKYKNQFLDFAVQGIYTILTNDDKRELNNDKDLIKKICKVLFPLCISDYPRYDELILHLNTSQLLLFQEVINNATPYIKSKLTSILDDFKEADLHVNQEKNFTDHGLTDMTMINPLKRTANDPTVSLRPGFTTDMTMIVPNFKTHDPVLNHLELKEESNEMDVDIKESTDEDKKVDYMGDIFNPSKENTEKVNIADDMEMDQVDIQVENIEEEQKDPPKHVIHDVDMQIEINRDTSESPVPHSPSPFLDNDSEDDKIIDIDSHSRIDEATEKLTSKIGEIHISPEKKPFGSPDRKSLNNIIDQSDPFFLNTKKHIKIFEDSPTKSTLATDKKLINFELSKFDILKESEDVTIVSIKELLKSLQTDNATNVELNKLVKSLHQLINHEEILDWVRESGFKEIMLSLINYFNTSINITKRSCFKCLISFKELLIVSEYLDNLINLEEFISIWNILVMIVEHLKDFKNELYVSLDELVDDLLELNLKESKPVIFKNCCLSLKTPNDNLLLTSFYLLTLTKCIERENLTIEQIKDIDSIVFRYLSSNEVEVRRLTIIIYSKCKTKLQEFDQNSNDYKFEIHDDNKKTVQDTYDDVFQKLSLPQIKLVDYYCEN